MELDFEKLKDDIFNFVYKNRLSLIGLSGIFCVFVFVGSIYFRNEHISRLNSSNQLIDYIEKRNDDFLKKNHKKGYTVIKEFIKNNNNPDEKVMDEFAKIDEFVFKNLFYFAKRIYFGKKDDFHNFYISDKHPWSKLMKTCDVFYNEQPEPIIPQKDDYLISFLIGRGVEC